MLKFYVSVNIENFKNADNAKDIVVSHYSFDEGLDNLFTGKGPFLAFIGGTILWFLDSIQVVIIAFAIFIVLHLFVVSPHTIEGPSMEPNFCNGDVVLADKLTPIFQGYQYGDVIIFKKNDMEDYIKRIIGKGGDKVKVENGRVYRNGELLEEIYLPPGRKTEILQGSLMVEGVEYKVPNGYLMVFGDNRSHSIDSRVFLAIDPRVNTIKGRVVALIWPLRDMRIFDKNAVRDVDACKGF